MIVTKGYGSNLIVTQGYGGSIARIKREVLRLISKIYKSLILTSEL